ncbi:hypothetical protein M9H77_12132 [Catharanthus roseus]|uniref:Uncharacterized protein n=1 Tax=Catharanthus roseus TaxID=4058 RepID=A0ACC0BGR0_CATRO|nr:hypothetical protein M9H77_12132 [Catharanthus roseus]
MKFVSQRRSTTGGKSSQIPESRPSKDIFVEVSGSFGVIGGKKRLKKFEPVWQQTGPTPGRPQEPDMFPSYSDNGHITTAIWRGQITLQSSFILFDFIFHV